jgi:F-type H+-transporting ATPase subunit epsilon
MTLDIITPDSKLFSGEIKSVVVPGSEGSLGIMNRHAPMVASLKKGKCKVTDASNAVKEFDIKGGVVEVSNNKVIILAE